MKYQALERNVEDYRKRYAVVLTPNGGIITCKDISAAQRVADDMNALCNRIAELDPNGDNGPKECETVTEIMEHWQRV